MIAKGWAIVERGVISVRSVSPTRRAAIVNFLIVSRTITVHNGMSDEFIEQLWNKHRHDAEPLEVTITTQ